MPPNGIKILSVENKSIAENAGLSPGDVILEIDKHMVSDELALRFYLAEESVELLVQHPDGREQSLIVDLPDQSPLGIQIEDFKTRTCCNACIFCFVDQLPPAVRPGLKIKDDDYRLSFLHGNYITLTNLKNRDISRIIDQRLSPLYVSVHATEPDLRSRILGREKPDNMVAKIRKLVDHRITLHAQIVLMPGINDALHLEKTLLDLRNFYPGVQSVAVVPLGLSNHGHAKNRLQPITPSFCRKTIRQIQKWQNLFRAQTGESFVYLADEFYIQGGMQLPEADLYDGFSQIEDGVGMVRTFLDAFEREWTRRRKPLPVNGTIVTGSLFYPTLKQCIDRLNQKFTAGLRVCAAQNRFLGNTITVAGLLSGEDILRALQGGSPGDFIIIPQEALSRPDKILLDDMSPADLAASLQKPVYPSGYTIRDFFLLLKKLAAKSRRN